MITKRPTYVADNRASSAALRKEEGTVPRAEGERPLPQSSPLRLAVRVFLLFSAIYLSTWAGHYTSGDGSFKVAWAKAMFTGGAAGPARVR